jgi:hypothetical protein
MKNKIIILALLLFNLSGFAQLTDDFLTLSPSLPNKITFSYTGSNQTWTVPENVTTIFVEVYGAQGGDHPNGFTGGNGGLVNGYMVVIPGSTLSLTVGGKPTTRTALYGFGGNGGSCTSDNTKISNAGGGLSCISTAFPISLSNVIVVAGGGGAAASGFSGIGGAAGGSTGSDGIGNYGGTPTRGRGGSQTTGGAGGSQYDPNSSAPTAGSALKGGNGGIVNPSTWSGGGGGGAGYYGGGGGAGGGNAVGSGGGGSSYFSSSMIGATNNAGTNTGHGKIIISY